MRGLLPLLLLLLVATQMGNSAEESLDQYAWDTDGGEWKCESKVGCEASIHVGDQEKPMVVGKSPGTRLGDSQGEEVAHDKLATCVSTIQAAIGSNQKKTIALLREAQAKLDGASGKRKPSFLPQGSDSHSTSSKMLKSKPPNCSAQARGEVKRNTSKDTGKEDSDAKVSKQPSKKTSSGGKGKGKEKGEETLLGSTSWMGGRKGKKKGAETVQAGPKRIPGCTWESYWTHMSKQPVFKDECGSLFNSWTTVRVPAMAPDQNCKGKMKSHMCSVQMSLKEWLLLGWKTQQSANRLQKIFRKKVQESIGCRASHGLQGASTLKQIARVSHKLFQTIRSAQAQNKVAAQHQMAVFTTDPGQTNDFSTCRSHGKWQQKLKLDHYPFRGSTYTTAQPRLKPHPESGDGSTTSKDKKIKLRNCVASPGCEGGKQKGKRDYAAETHMPSANLGALEKCCPNCWVCETLTKGLLRGFACYKCDPIKGCKKKSTICKALTLHQKDLAWCKQEDLHKEPKCAKLMKEENKRLQKKRDKQMKIGGKKKGKSKSEAAEDVFPTCTDIRTGYKFAEQTIDIIKLLAKKARLYRSPLLKQVVCKQDGNATSCSTNKFNACSLDPATEEGAAACKETKDDFLLAQHF